MHNVPVTDDFHKPHIIMDFSKTKGELTWLIKCVMQILDLVSNIHGQWVLFLLMNMAWISIQTEDMFLQNVSWLSMNYMAYPRRHNSSLVVCLLNTVHMSIKPICNSKEHSGCKGTRNARGNCIPVWIMSFCS